MRTNKLNFTVHTNIYNHMMCIACNHGGHGLYYVQNIIIWLKNILICAIMNIQYYTIHFSTNLCNTKFILTNEIQEI